MFARIAKTNYDGLGGLHNANSLLHSSGGQKSKIKLSAGLVCPKASLFGL
jgi:hypothetical protein